ncbi:hypothetical protein KIPB_002843, partial [Kipferlia bialata]|eukprot:g2843.t1
MGIRRGLEVYVAGLFNGAATSTPSHRARIPPYLNVNVTMPEMSHCGTALDMVNGLVIRRYTGDEGTAYEGYVLEQTWIAHQTIPQCLVMEIGLTCPSGACAPINPVTVSLSPFIGDDIESGDVVVAKVEHTPTYDLYTCHTVTEETEGSGIEEFGLVVPVIPDTIEVTPGEYTRFTLSVDTMLTSGSLTPAESALEAYTHCTYTDRDTLYSTHTQVWNDIMSARITIKQDGSQFLSRTSMSAVYYILSGLRHDEPQGLSPGGLTNNMYNGHTFWDQETHIFPTFMFISPEMGLSMLEYRMDSERISQARLKAHNLGYDGLVFPWESAYSGVECTPDGNPEGTLEVHVTGDIVFAVKQAFEMTGDVEWLTQQIDWLVDTARYWESRTVFNSTMSLYTILDVQCPDESSLHVDNSVYTNAVAAVNLGFIVDICNLTGYQGVNQSDLDTWTDIAQRMYYPFDSDLALHPEYDGFIEEPHLIRQCDVVLLQYPLGYPSMNVTTAECDIDYYTEWTNWGTGYLTGDAFYVNAWLGLAASLADGDTQQQGHSEYAVDKADDVWQANYDHLRGPFYTWTEKADVYGHTPFITGAGDFLQTYIFGYLGARIEANALVFHPVALPPMPLCQQTDPESDSGDGQCGESPAQELRVSKIYYRG